MKKQLVIALAAMGMCLTGAQAAITNSVSAKLTVSMEESMDTKNEDTSKWKVVKSKGTNKDLLYVFAEANPQITLSKKAKLVRVGDEFFVVDGNHTYPYPFMSIAPGEVRVGSGTYNEETGAGKESTTLTAALHFNSEPVVDEEEGEEPVVLVEEETDKIAFSISGLVKVSWSTSKYNADDEQMASESYQFSGVGEGTFEGEDAIVEGSISGSGKGLVEADEQD